MNKSTLEYKAYLGLLEGKITSEERKVLINEIGFLKKLGVGIKSLFQAGGESLGGLKTLYNNKQFKGLSAETEKEITTSVTQLRKIGTKLQIPDDQINFVISKLLLSSSGINPKEFSLAAKNKLDNDQEEQPSEDIKPGTIPAQEVPTGTKVDPSAANFLQVLTQMIADATGKPMEKVADEVNKKKMDAASLKKYTASLVSKSTGVPADKVLKIFSALMETGHLSENRNHKSVMSQKNDSNLIFERWQRLAGINSSKVLTESADALKHALAKIKNNQVKDILDINQILKDDKKGKLTDEEAQQVVDALEKKNIVKPEEEEKAVEQLATEKQASDKKASDTFDRAREYMKLNLGLNNKEDQEKFTKSLATNLKSDPKKVSDQVEKVGMEEFVKSAMEQQPEAVKKAAAEAGAELPADAKQASTDKKEEPTNKTSKFTRARDDIKEKVGKDVSDDEINKVLTWFDENDNLVGNP
jgi:hypothetical protein